MNGRNNCALTLERAMELLNTVIDYVAAGENTVGQLKALFRLGFTADELVHCFHYSETDVKEFLESADTDDEGNIC